MQINKLIINAFLFCKGREEIDFSSIDEKILKNIDKDTKKMIDEVLKRLVTLGIANIKNR